MTPEAASLDKPCALSRTALVSEFCFKADLCCFYHNPGGPPGGGGYVWLKVDSGWTPAQPGLARLCGVQWRRLQGHFLLGCRPTGKCVFWKQMEGRRGEATGCRLESQSWQRGWLGTVSVDDFRSLPVEAEGKGTLRNFKRENSLWRQGGQGRASGGHCRSLVSLLSAPLSYAGPRHSAWHSAPTFGRSHTGLGTPGCPALSAGSSGGRASELSPATVPGLLDLPSPNPISEFSGSSRLHFF